MTFGAKYFTYVLYNVLYILQLHKIIFSPADQPYFPNFNPAVEFFFKSLASKSVPILTLPIGIILLVRTQNFSKKNYFLPMPLPPSPLFLKSYFARDVFQGNSLLYHSQRHPKFFWPRHFQNFVGGPATA